MAELTLEESLRQILPTLPLPIQKFFEQRKLGETARLLMERYALHIDQGAILERELMLLLLGLENPDEFADALYKELPVSKQTVADIMIDLNKEVFVPLREEMRKGGGQTQEQKPRTPAPPPPPRPVMPPPSYQPKPPAPMPPPPPRQTPPPVMQRSEPVQPLNTVIIPANPRLPSRPPDMYVPMPRYTSRPSPKATEGTAPWKGQTLPTSQKIVDTSRMLEDHEEPHIEFKKTSEPLRPSVAFGVGGPPNLPGALPPDPLTPPAPKPHPSAPVAPYSTDPYREPIDEDGSR